MSIRLNAMQASDFKPWWAKCTPTFELLTGFVFSASQDQIDAFTDVIRLSDCLDKCANDSRFEKCMRDWAFEKVPKHQLVGFSRKSRRVGSKEACAEHCLQEEQFVCRSFNYDNNSGTCSLSDMDRHSVGLSKNFRSAPGNGDYYESNCAKDPVSLCEFKQVSGEVLKTVDAVYTDIQSREECRRLCLTANFRCHSYDHGDSGPNVCRLSHHSKASLVNTRAPYLEIAGATTHEMDTCYNGEYLQPSLNMAGTGMTAIIETSKVFNGKIYPKSEPRSCVVDVVNSLKFEFIMEYNDLDCAVKQIGYGKYANDIVIQHHDKIVTTQDLGVSLKCNYDLDNKTVSNGFGVGGEIPAGGTQSATVRSPTVIMKITNPDGSKISTAKVGDSLSIRFEIDEPTSPYDIFVRELIAVDGVDSNEIMLIDSDGCPTEPSIMSQLIKDGPQGKVLTAAFNAFKFPSTDIVQFKALVTPCLPACEPAQCETLDQSGQSVFVNSFGKRKKRNTNGNRHKIGNREDMVVIESLHVSDTFFDKKSRSIGQLDQSESKATLLTGSGRSNQKKCGRVDHETYDIDVTYHINYGCGNQKNNGQWLDEVFKKNCILCNEVIVGEEEWNYHPQSKKHKIALIKHYLKINRQTLIQDKKGVIFTTSSDYKDVISDPEYGTFSITLDLGMTLDFELSIYNCGNSTVRLESCHLLYKVSCVEIKDKLNFNRRTEQVILNSGSLKKDKEEQGANLIIFQTALLN
ncbi:hypothetical protein GQR58_006077 [Nymphon striatum]|nr:hypothetical protein GQR58_006077 [Nymphon striatum]